MLYDFGCHQCEAVFEVRKRHDDTSPTPCPECGSQKTRKLILTTPMFFVSWQRPLGLGHDGYVILGAAKNGKQPPKSKKKSGGKHENEHRSLNECAPDDGQSDRARHRRLPAV